MTGWGVLAVVPQIVGIALAVLGLEATWREFHEPGERFLDPFLRLLRRLDPRRDRVVKAELADAVATTDEANAVQTFPDLPDDDRAAIEELAGRLQQLRGSLETAAGGLRRELVDVTRRVDGLEGRVTAEVERLESADRAVAADGLRVEAVGLVFVALGLGASVLDALTR